MYPFFVLRQTVRTTLILASSPDIRALRRSNVSLIKTYPLGQEQFGLKKIWAAMSKEETNSRPGILNRRKCYVTVPMIGKRIQSLSRCCDSRLRRSCQRD